MTRRNRQDSGAGRPGEGEIDGDLLLAADDSLENGDILRWIRALDLHVLGACRADERLNPFLKLAAPTASANGDDRLISHLAQHFEAPEVGMLLRCLCAPLVSVRVGKIRKQGNLLCPTNIRGILNLTLLPSSNLRISFCGDDGCNERMAIIPHISESLEEVSAEGISVDNSGRSFLLKLPGSQISYFWCSEKSKSHGVDLIHKMKSILQKRPSLSQLTGICETRLDTFATHLRACLLVSTNSSKISDVPLLAAATSFQEFDLSSQSTPTTSRSHRFRQAVSQSGRSYPQYQGSLSPRSSTFKDGSSRSLSTLKNEVKERIRKRGDNNPSLFSTDLGVPTSLYDIPPSGNNCLNGNKLKEDDDNPTGGLSTLSSLTSGSSFSTLPFHLPVSQLPASSSPLLSPYYCWCPPCPTPVQHMSTSSVLPSAASDSLPLPPLSSLLSAARSVPFLPSEPPREQSQIPNFQLPSVLPSSYVPKPNSQQIPTFTPFICDSIVHVPIIDVCSSGPGYLVSSGSSISSTMPSLLPSLVNPLTEAESVVEKSARETLRMLMASSPTSPQLMRVLPSVLSPTEESFQNNHAKEKDIMVAGSRGLYTGVQDIDAIANSICLIDLPPSTSRAAMSRSRAANDENNENHVEANVGKGEEAKDSE